MYYLFNPYWFIYHCNHVEEIVHAMTIVDVICYQNAICYILSEE